MSAQPAADPAPRVYIVLTSLGVGGAEKRFAELFRELVRRGLDVYLVLPATTYRQLLERPDLADLPDVEQRIVRFVPRSTGLSAMLRALWPTVRAIPRGSVVHYPLAHFPFIHRWLGHRLVVSWVGAFLPALKIDPSRIRYLGLLWLGLLEARLVDVLNPLIRDRLARWPALRRKLRLTGGGTFVDLAHFKPAPKRDQIVFLGRWEADKNALAFVEGIPATHRRLAALRIDAEFLLYGMAGDQGPAIHNVLDRPEYRRLRIRTGHSPDPASVLGSAKVFVSLQTSSNYPSKALAEAMACGCVPIITNVGESRMMATDSVAQFIPLTFTPGQLADAIARAVGPSAEAFAHRSAEVRAFAEERFQIAVQADYFERLYAEAVEQC